MHVENVYRGARLAAAGARAGNSAKRFYKKWKTDTKKSKQARVHRGETDVCIGENTTENG
jgi:hypothetical protein